MLGQRSVRRLRGDAYAAGMLGHSTAWRQLIVDGGDAQRSDATSMAWRRDVL